MLADCYRALRRYDRVEALWDELRAASPSAAIVTEGRIVTAGARADQGDLRGAIGLLERSAATPRRVRDHHLRQWYALADLYDRSGDAPRARAPVHEGPRRPAGVRRRGGAPRRPRPLTSSARGRPRSTCPRR